MITPVVLPNWGMGIEEGTVTRWLKSVGDSVVEGEALVEIETAKASQEIQSPATGTLVEILLQEGQTTMVNTAIAVIRAG